jgi:hypothetical protein
MATLAHWYDATRTTPFPPATLTAMRAAPNFHAAIRVAAREIVAQYDADPELSRTLNDSARMTLGFLALYLDAEGGLTLARIQTLMTELGLSSPGRSAAVLIRLRMLGFVAPAPVQPDRRSRVYQPTERLRRVIATNMRAGFTALSLIEPEAATIPPLLDNPQVFRRLMLDLGGGFIKSSKVSPAPPLLQTFTQHNLGMLLVYTLLTAAPEDRFAPSGPIPIAIAAISRRYRFSRSHVQRLFRAGEDGGFFSRDTASGTVTLHAPLFESLAEFYAFYFAALAACAYSALQERAAEPRIAAS